MKLWSGFPTAETGGGGEVVDLTARLEEWLSAKDIAEVQVIGRPGSR